MKTINYRLYLFELIFACLVIFAHTSFDVGEYYFDAIGRTTVIFFFILSSFYYNKTLNREDYTYKVTLKKCLRLLLVGITAILVHLVIRLPIAFVTLGTPTGFMDFFNRYFPNLGFMWFVFALIICYLIYPFIHKVKWIHTSKYMIVIPIITLTLVYFFRVFAGKYDFGFFSRYEVTRNFLFTGLPCFLIGTYIYDHHQEYRSVKPVFFYITIVILTGTLMVEAFIHEWIMTSVNEFYLSSIAIAVISFLYCIQYPELKFGEFLYEKVFGRTGPTIIYLYHLLFLMAFGFMNSMFYCGSLATILLTIVASMLLAVLYHLIDIVIKNKRTS